MSDSEAAHDLNVDEILTAIDGHGAYFVGQAVGSTRAVVRDLAGQTVGPSVDAMALAATPDGKTLASLSAASENGNRQLAIWTSGRTISSVAVAEFTRLVGLDNKGKYVATTLGARRNSPASLAVYQADELREVGSIDGGSVDIVASMDPTGELVALGDLNLLSLRRLPDLAPAAALRLAGAIQDIVFSPSGRQLVVIDASGTLTVVGRDGRLIMTARTFFQRSQRRAAAFSPDDRLLAVVGQVAGKSKFYLFPILGDSSDRELCNKLVDEPDPNTWATMLPNDNPPAGCTEVTAGKKVTLHRGHF